MKSNFNRTIIFLWILTYAVTTFLFFYWTKAENRDTLFAFNLGYSLFLELVFYGFIFITLLNSRKILGATYSVLGTITSIYIFFGIITALGFNIYLLHVISVKWYYSVVILGTLIGIIATVFSLKLNDSLSSEKEHIDAQTKSKSALLKELKYLENSYNTALSTKGMSESFESEYSSVIDKLLNKLKFINPKDLEDDFTSSKISKQLSLLNNYVSEMKKEESDGALIHKQVIVCVDDTISFINSLK
jgi:hypothetical protein